MAAPVTLPALLHALTNSAVVAPDALCQATWDSMGATAAAAVAVCAYPTLPAGLHTTIGAMEELDARCAWVGHPQTTPAQLRNVLTTDTRTDVRVAVAGAPNLDGPLVETLLNYPDTAIWEELTENAAVSCTHIGQAVAQILGTNEVILHLRAGGAVVVVPGAALALFTALPHTFNVAAGTYAWSAIRQAAEAADAPEAWARAYELLVYAALDQLEEALNEAEQASDPGPHLRCLGRLIEELPLQTVGDWLENHPATATLCATTVGRAVPLLDRSGNFNVSTADAHRHLDEIRERLHLVVAGQWPVPDTATEQQLRATASRLIEAGLTCDLAAIYTHPALTVEILQSLTAAGAGTDYDLLVPLVEAHAANPVVMSALVTVCEDDSLFELRIQWEDIDGDHQTAVLDELFKTAHLPEADRLLAAGFEPPQSWWATQSAYEAIDWLLSDPTGPVAAQVAAALTGLLGDATVEQWTVFLTLLATEAVAGHTTLADLAAATAELTATPRT